MTLNSGSQLERESRGGGTVVSTANSQREISRRSFMRLLGLGLGAVAGGCAVGANRITDGRTLIERRIIFRDQQKRYGEFKDKSTSYRDFEKIELEFERKKARGEIPSEIRNANLYYDYLKDQEINAGSER